VIRYTEACLENCGTLHGLREAGVNQEGIRATIETICGRLGLQGCKTDGPQLSPKDQNVKVCGLYYNPEVAAAVVGAAALLKAEILIPAAELQDPNVAHY
jgi:hypothetical protein